MNSDKNGNTEGDTIYVEGTHICRYNRSGIDSNNITSKLLIIPRVESLPIKHIGDPEKALQNTFDESAEEADPSAEDNLHWSRS